MGDFVNLLFYLVIYIYMAIALQSIAIKTGTPDGWLAWIPIANIYLMCKIAGKPGWWLLLLLIPIVNVVIYVIIWMEIAKACGKEAWLGFLMLIPLINLVVPGYLGFSE